MKRFSIIEYSNQKFFGFKWEAWKYLCGARYLIYSLALFTNVDSLSMDASRTAPIYYDDILITTNDNIQISVPDSFAKKSKFFIALDKDFAGERTEGAVPFNAQSLNYLFDFWNKFSLLKSDIETKNYLKDFFAELNDSNMEMVAELVNAVDYFGHESLYELLVQACTDYYNKSILEKPFHEILAKNNLYTKLSTTVMMAISREISNQAETINTCSVLYQLRSFIKNVDITDFTLSPLGNRLALGLKDGTFELWKKTDLSWKKKRGWKKCDGGSINSIQFSSDGKKVLTCSGNSITIWDAIKGKRLNTCKNSSSVRCFAISPSGNSFAAASDTSFCIWSMNGKCCSKDSFAADLICHLQNKIITAKRGDVQVSIRSIHGFHMFKAHEKGIIDLKASPDGSLFATVAEDCTIAFWDAQNLSLLGRLQEGCCKTKLLAFSHNSKDFINISSDETIKVWNIDNKVCKQTLNNHCRPIASVVTVPKSNLAVSIDEAKCSLWDTEEGILLEDVRINAVEKPKFCVDSQGKHLAILTSAKIIDLYSLPTKEQIEKKLALNKSAIHYDLGSSFEHALMVAKLLDVKRKQEKISFEFSDGFDAKDFAALCYAKEIFQSLPAIYRNHFSDYVSIES